MPFPILVVGLGALLSGGGATATVSALNQDHAGKFEVTVDMDPITERRSGFCAESVTLTAEEIYRRVRGGPGLPPLSDAQDAAAQLAERYNYRAEQIGALREKMAHAWQGDAAESAMAHTQPLMDAFQQSHDLLRDSARPLSAQMDVFQHAYNNVEKVPADPPTSNLLNDMWPFNTSTDDAIAEYNKKASKNVEVYNVYNGASTGNGGQLPQDYPAPTVGSVPPVAVQPPGGPPVTWTTDPATTPAGNQPTATVNTLAPAIRPGEPFPHSTPAVTPPPASGGNTTPQGWAPDPVTTRATTPPATGGINPPGATPIGPVTGYGVGTGRPAPGGGPGPGGRNGAPGNGPRAGTGGANPNLTSQATRTATAAAGGRGTAGLGGIPVGAGRTGKGDEDTEHRRKYPLGPDPKKLFSVDELFAPPVIGDDR